MSRCPITDIAVLDACTKETCPLTCSQTDFLPTLAGNSVYLAIFAVLLLAQVYLGVRHRTWGFMTGMVCGLVLEIVSYAGRLMMRDDPFSFDNFIIYLVPITIAPAFICASIYLSLSRIVIVHGAHLSRFSPRFYAITFMTCDFVSLVLQGAGGGLAATADDEAGGDTGRGIMIAGLVSQLISIMVFMGLWVEFAWRLRKFRESEKNVMFLELRATKQFKLFTYAVWFAIILIFIRSVYRIAELQEGFHGPIANNEVLFMILEGPMIFLAVLGLTVLHPGIGFKGQWNLATWSLRGRKSASADREEIAMSPKSDNGGLLRSLRK